MSAIDCDEVGLPRTLDIRQLAAVDDQPDGRTHYVANRYSPMIRKQLDRVAKASHRIFADAFEVEIALDQIGERAG